MTTKQATTPTCPVRDTSRGLDMGPCGWPATHRAEITCDNGCPREPVDVCDEHADVLRGDEDTSFCGLCVDAGRYDARVRLASITPLAAEETS